MSEPSDTSTRRQTDERISIQKRLKRGGGGVFVTVRTKPQTPAPGIPVVFANAGARRSHVEFSDMQSRVLDAIAAECVDKQALATAFTALECIRTSDDAAPVVNKLALMSPCSMSAADFISALKNAVERNVAGFSGNFEIVAANSRFPSKDETSPRSLYLRGNEVSVFLCTVSEFPNMQALFNSGLSLKDITWPLPISVSGKQYSLLQLLPTLLARSLHECGSPRIAAQLESIMEQSQSQNWRGKTLPVDAILKLSSHEFVIAAGATVAPGGTSVSKACVPVMPPYEFEALTRASSMAWSVIVQFADELIKLPVLPHFPISVPQEWDGAALYALHQCARSLVATNPMTGWMAYVRASTMSTYMRAGLWQLILLPFAAVSPGTYNPLAFV